MSTRDRKQAMTPEEKVAREKLAKTQEITQTWHRHMVATQRLEISVPPYETRNAWLREPAKVAA